MGISGKTALDFSTASVSRKGGTSVQVKAVLLSPEEAALLGEYASWCSRERLMPKLFCRDCGPECEVEVNIDPHTIGIFCNHRMIWYEGPIPLVETHHPDAGESLTVVRVIVPEVPMAQADAFMLRRYRKLLDAYGLQEAIWCLSCEGEGQAAGVKAYVRPDRISFMCRCKHRTYAGLTL